MTRRQASPASIDDVLARIGEQKLVAVVRSQGWAQALQTSRALLESGQNILEVTYTTPEASRVISTLKAEVSSDVLIGAGTICSAHEARAAADSGADFLVSPGSPPPLLEAMLATELLVLPGVMTPTEIIDARAQGVAAVKLFPASLIGPSGLAILRGPFPDLAFIPTGGITMDDVDAWLDAGAHAVGLGNSLRASEETGSSSVPNRAARPRP
ncbi:MAG: bifunctional 4-hydroxy-2-oxoglutarate aldolase/2-dehydro-3-deoxy-phosphogluconate aldolase [Nocardioidaceae bacterium]|jgi:2-dehydro-3-deoxyphosphogluconate aldolase/(4S)-4-hydroxy-2-oxoglutarate aldolase